MTDGERQYHIEVAPGELSGPVLLPGDPDRIEKITATWDHPKRVADHREFRSATGEYEGEPVSATSTGIGSPSAAIAVEELARVGCESFIRVGSCGTIRPEVDIGDLVITSGAVRQEGTSDEYVREAYPASADHEVVSALVAAAEDLGYDYHVGLTASTDSFYAGQSRTGFRGFEARGSEEKLEELRAANVYNFEMEASAVLTLANLYDLRAGAVCTVYADRTTGEFRVEGQRRAAETATLAAAYLSRMDREKERVGADRWHAGLSLNSNN